MGVSNLKELILILIFFKLILILLSFLIKNKSKVLSFLNILYPVFLGFQINTKLSWRIGESLYLNDEGIGLLTMASVVNVLLIIFNVGKNRDLNNIFYIFLLFLTIFILGSLSWITLFFCITIFFICFSFLYLMEVQKESQNIRSGFFLSNSIYILFLFLGIVFFLASTGDLSFGPLEIVHYNFFPISLIFFFIFFCGLMGVFPFHNWLVESINEFKGSDLLAYLFYTRIILGFIFFKKVFLFMGELNLIDSENFISFVKIMAGVTCFYGSLISIRKCSLKEKLAFHPCLFSGIILIFLCLPKFELRYELFLFLILFHTFSLAGTINFLSRKEKESGFSAIYFLILLFSLIGFPVTLRIRPSISSNSSVESMSG